MSDFIPLAGQYLPQLFSGRINLYITTDRHIICFSTCICRHHGAHSFSQVTGSADSALATART